MMRRLPPLRVTVRLLKGGGGATTTATNLAFACSFLVPRAKILLVDGDPPNGSIYERAEEAIADGTWPDAIHVERWKPDEIPEAMAEVNAAGEYHHVFIESQNDATALSTALMHTNHLVIPVSPDSDDAKRLVPTMEVAAEAMRERDPAIPALALSILMVKVTYNSVDARSLREQISERSYPVLETQIPLLAKFRRKGAAPTSIEEIFPYDEALREIVAIERSRS